MNDLALVYTTYPNNSEAEAIAEKLLSQKLIACANIFPKGTSMYVWNDKVEKTEEVFAILKVPQVHLEKLRLQFLELHSYKCPCFIEIPTGLAHKDYIQWAINACP